MTGVAFDGRTCAAAEVGVSEGAHRRTDRGLEIKLAADSEDAIADGLGVEPALVRAPEEIVVRVGREVFGVGHTAELVSAGQGNLADQLLHRPAVRHEAARQVVEQFRMRRALAGRAEVVWRADDALAEKVLPNAVGHDAGRERVLRAGDPVGQFDPAALAGRNLRWPSRAEHGHETTGNDRTLLLQFAANVDGAVGGLAVEDGHGPVAAGLTKRRRGGGRLGIFRGLLRWFGCLGCLGRVRTGLQARVGSHFLRLGHALETRGQPWISRHELFQLGLHFRREGLAGGRRVFHGCGNSGGRERRRRGEALDQRHMSRGLAVLALLATGNAVVRGGALEDAGQRVVIARGNGIELVIVATRATHGQAQRRARGHVDLLVHLLHDESLAIALVQALGPDGEEAGGDQQFVALRGVLGGQQVAGHLLAEKAVVGFVGIEGGDDVVAVAPRLREGIVALLAGGLRVARHVEPVPAPAFAELRRGEELVNDLGDCRLPVAGCRLVVLHERLHLLGRRWQADEVEVKPADEGVRVGVGDGLELVLLQLLQDEAVYVRRAPLGVLGLRHSDRFDRLEGPEVLALGEVGLLGELGLAVARVRRAHEHPLLEVGDDLGRELLLGRHELVLLLAANRRDEQAALEIARLDGVASRAAHPDALARVQQQTAFDLLRLGGMALIALGHQHGANLPLEER